MKETSKTSSSVITGCKAEKERNLNPNQDQCVKEQRILHHRVRPQEMILSVL